MLDFAFPPTAKFHWFTFITPNINYLQDNRNHVFQDIKSNVVQPIRSWLFITTSNCSSWLDAIVVIFIHQAQRRRFTAIILRCQFRYTIKLVVPLYVTLVSEQRLHTAFLFFIIFFYQRKLFLSDNFNDGLTGH